MLTRAWLCSLAVLGLLLPAAVAIAQEKPDGKPEMTPDEKAEMAAAMPGPAHEKLAKLAGDWTTAAKMTMPGGPPTEESASTSKITVVLEGRFIHEESSGTMMGQPFKSAKLMGYNNGSKKYEAVWTYTMGTGMMTMSGTSEDEGKTIKFNASYDNAMGTKDTMTITYRITDDDHFTVTLDGGKMPDGSAGPVMEVLYTRKK